MAADILTATVTGAKPLNRHVRELHLRPDRSPLDCVPGQWISLRLPVGDRPPLIRAYSLAAPPASDGTLTLCLDRVDDGLGSGYLWEIAEGARLEFTGPLGNFTLPEDSETPLLLAARFTGVVPFRAMLLALDTGLAAPRPVRLIHGAPNPDDLIYHEELTVLAARADWFEYYPVIAAPETDFLEQRARDWMPFIPMLCGVREFTFPTRAFFIENLGFERRAVKVENYNGPTAR